MQPVDGGFGCWQAIQILAVILILAWFMRSLRMPTKFSQRQQERREQRLERRRREMSLQSTNATTSSEDQKKETEKNEDK